MQQQFETLIDARLHSIENKVEKLTDVVVALARLEEKQFTATDKIDSISKRLLVLEDSVNKNSYFTRGAERIVWLVVAAGIAGVWRFLG